MHNEYDYDQSMGAPQQIAPAQGIRPLVDPEAEGEVDTSK